MAVSVPGDKSISHRSLFLEVCSSVGETKVMIFCVRGCALNLAGFSTLVLKLEDKDGVVTIQGVGMDGLKVPRNA